jgi:hypothetical protein
MRTSAPHVLVEQQQTELLPGTVDAHSSPLLEQPIILAIAISSTSSVLMYEETRAVVAVRMGTAAPQLPMEQQRLELLPGTVGCAIVSAAKPTHSIYNCIP